MTYDFKAGVLVGSSTISIRERQGRWEVVYDGAARLFFDTEHQAAHRAEKLVQALIPPGSCPACGRRIDTVKRRFAPHFADVWAPGNRSRTSQRCPGSGLFASNR